MLRLLSLALVCVIMMVVAASALSSRSGTAAETAATPASDAKQLATNNREDTELDRDPSGKFRIGAIVNGEDTQFLLDTGADTIALGIEEAERLGIEIDPETFTPIAETASGTGNGAHIQIRSIEVAGQEFHDVDAIVIEGLRENLLGQSLLRKLGKVEIQGDKMVIRRS
jgi:aspartyl protease family protein